MGISKFFKFLSLTLMLSFPLIALSESSVGAICSDDSKNIKIYIDYEKEKVVFMGDHFPSYRWYSWADLRKEHDFIYGDESNVKYEYHAAPWLSVNSWHFQLRKNKSSLSAKFRTIRLSGCSPKLGFSCSDPEDPELKCESINYLPSIARPAIKGLKFPVCDRTEIVKKHIESLTNKHCSEISIGDFKSLGTSIDLSNLNISFLREGDLEGFAQAYGNNLPVEVDLSRNLLNSLPKNLLGTCEWTHNNKPARCTMRKLDLSGNRFTEFPFREASYNGDYLYEVDNVEDANLSHNQISIDNYYNLIKHETLGRYPEHLDLSYNRIETIPLEPKSMLPTVHVSGKWKFTGNPIKTISKLILWLSGGGSVLLMDELPLVEKIEIKSRSGSGYFRLGGTKNNKLNLDSTILGYNEFQVLSLENCRGAFTTKTIEPVPQDSHGSSSWVAPKWMWDLEINNCEISFPEKLEHRDYENGDVLFARYILAKVKFKNTFITGMSEGILSSIQGFNRDPVFSFYRGGNSMKKEDYDMLIELTNNETWGQFWRVLFTSSVEDGLLILKD